MIKYTLKVGDEVETLECETMDELLQYLKANKSEVVNVNDDKRMTATEIKERRDSLANEWKEQEAIDQINNAPNYID